MHRLTLLLMILLVTGCAGENADNMETSNTEENVEVASESTAEPDDENHQTETEPEQVEPDTSEAETPAFTPDEQVEILKDEREGIIPERIEIPAIEVDAEVMSLGLRDNGEMDVPESLHDTSWYEPGYEVGAPGNAVIAGHVDDTVNPGVFKQLHTLSEGDEIIVHGEDGATLTFTVYNKELLDADEAPVDKIFGYSHNSLLNLITCEGPYDYDAGGTPNRWVIYTELNTDA